MLVIHGGPYNCVRKEYKTSNGQGTEIKWLDKGMGGPGAVTGLLVLGV